ncbi:MAG: hypothetical protein WC516_02425 [Patescibacteria group bacterium]
MTTLVLAIIVLIISLFWLGRILFRRLPDIKNLDISSLPDLKQAEARNKLLEIKFFRQKKKVDSQLGKYLSPTRNFFRDRLAGAKAKILSLEKKYAGGNDKTKVKEEVVILTADEAIKETEKLINQEEYALAEKKMIDLISRETKNVKAYEFLAEIYFKNKNYDQAEEVLKYLIKVTSLKHLRGEKKSPKGQSLEEVEKEIIGSVSVDNKVAVYYDDLAQIYEIEKKSDKALDCYLKSNAIEPNNPKYLDKVIELAIAVGDKGLAKKTLKRLKEINAENAKLSEFKETIEKM